MKTNIFIIMVICLFFSSCKTTTSTNSKVEEKQRLEGQWELNYTKDLQQKFEVSAKPQKEYSHRIPLIMFDLKQNIISGNNGCNSFSGKFIASGNTISMKGPMTATKMYCEGQGEAVFMQNLNKT